MHISPTLSPPTTTTFAMAATVTFFLILPLLLFSPSSATNVPILLPYRSSHSDPLLYLSSLAASPSSSPRRSSAPIASGSLLLNTPSYVVPASLGTPPQQPPLLLSFSTSFPSTFIPSSSAFSPSLSSTFRPLPASAPFNLSYASYSLPATLSRDTLSLAGDSIPNFTFALLQKTTAPIPPQGLLGLGRGPLSLLSQTESTYHSTFSYCLPGFRSSNFSGSLRLGPKGQPIRIKTTPLLSNPHRPTLYYVSMTGIRVGTRMLDIPTSAFALDPNTGAGTVFDSGTLFTRLVAPAYRAVRDEFRRRVGQGRNVTSLGGFDTCYTGIDPVPTVSFHFAGMNVTMPPENVVIRSTGSNLACLAMAEAAPDAVNAVLNVIAGWQQQNHRVLVDVPGGRLGVAREPCTAPL